METLYRVCSQSPRAAKCRSPSRTLFVLSCRRVAALQLSSLTFGLTQEVKPRPLALHFHLDGETQRREDVPARDNNLSSKLLCCREPLITARQPRGHLVLKFWEQRAGPHKQVPSPEERTFLKKQSGFLLPDQPSEQIYNPPLLPTDPHYLTLMI